MSDGFKSENESGIDSDNILNPVDTVTREDYGNPAPDDYQDTALNTGIEPEDIRTDESTMLPLAGDPSKNDGQAIGDLFAPNPAGIWWDSSDAILAPMGPTDPDEKATPTNRAITGNVLMANGFTPLRILPPDPKRTRLEIRIISDTATDVAWVGEEESDIQQGTDASLPPTAFVLSQATPLVLDGYTGSVAVSVPATGNTGPVRLTYIAIHE